MRSTLIVFLKGLGIGAANIVPGVSGGTIALLTNLFERLIHSIKSFDLEALKLFFSGRFKAFAKHTDLLFLLTVLVGALTGIYSLTFVLEPLLESYPVFVWAFFFGLIAASVYFVGKTVKRWTALVIGFFIVGALIALSLSTLIEPAAANSSMGYLFLCGMVAIMSMILPGLSGSFVLILMGNYQLIMIEGVQNMDMRILVPVGLGAVFGILAFSRLLAWALKSYKDPIISLLTGFILGSLSILWPWKEALFENFNGREKVVGYEWFLPQQFNVEVVWSIALMIVGALFIIGLEKMASKK